ncbi:hypothetical protein HYDPIDRAFT_113690 [Hydnomerulius pinastri MD-312]|uniref:F-box domain-containing protein n=1 Tax=Hydnomerulius pinastri MD-312 TaxID=994086 RepID=A0A0C9VBV1_9AGAM|nr:hypothetical protein HYDPIDRAFT_113690 [Hydnomerulius pinastri MD-312]
MDSHRTSTLQANYRPCFIHGLSVELLQIIFLYCLDLDCTELNDIGPVQTPSPCRAPLLFTSVCRHWRAVALDMPYLWNRINISVGLDLERAKIVSYVAGVGRWLDNSKDLPLTLRIREVQNPLPITDFTPWGDIFAVVSKHVARFSTINLFPAAMSSIFLAKASVSSLDILSSVNGCSWDDSIHWHRFFKQIQDDLYIRSLVLRIYDPILFRDHSLFQQLQGLTFQYAPEANETIQALAFCSRLSNLCLGGASFRWGDPVRPHSILKHESLQTLTIHDCGDDTLLLLGHLELPSLQKLAFLRPFHDSIEALYSMASLLSRSRCELELLSITGWRPALKELVQLHGLIRVVKDVYINEEKV